MLPPVVDEELLELVQIALLNSEQIEAIYQGFLMRRKRYGCINSV